MNPTQQAKLKDLAFHLQILPLQLPLPAAKDNINQLLHFMPCLELLNDKRPEAAANHSLEVALGLRNDSGVFNLPFQGPAVEALAKVLKLQLQSLPNSVLLNKWLDDSLMTSYQVLQKYGVTVPMSLDPLAGGLIAPSKMCIDGDDEVDAMIFEWNNIIETPDHSTESQSTQPTCRNKVKKPDTNDDKEDVDSRNGGTNAQPF
ncbi:hypothetical protein BDN71DRAFT_1429524 [Pleurotus eryngii]|uniref:Uncharacterized protein n=1 Tax=Pleurotus eryngii TaxID=5323 RepID=A0A9P5ZZD3_PLEER|nr:hypothetical protein BDN71DRAFT_1429524 [Pleurotus eryngii]